jgi:signal transduction histidine kinase
VQGEEPAPRLAPAQETALFRIAQEALNNVAKHAQARQVTVNLHAAAERVWLTVADDGVGFEPQHSRSAEGSPHLGLLTMREQAEAAGGSLEVESAPGQGTRIMVEVAR